MSIEENRIEKLKRKLYSRGSEPIMDIRTDVGPKKINETGDAWGNETLHVPEYIPEKSSTTFLRKFIVGAFLFFGLAIIIAIYMFFFGGNFMSSQNVDIKIVGPSSVSSGEEVLMTVSILNQNKVDMESVLLTIDYPDGTRDKTGDEPLIIQKEDVGTIKKGSLASVGSTFFLLGNKDTIKTISLKVEYRIKGSNAVFVKEKKYDISIGSSPVLLDVSYPKEVNSSQDVVMTVNVSSNSANLLKDVYVIAEYPYGFEFGASTLKPKESNNKWFLGDLKNGQKKTWTVSGKLLAQNNEERTFDFVVGTNSNPNSTGIDNILGQFKPTILVKKSFIDLQLSINGQSASTVALKEDSDMAFEISFKNILNDKLSNVIVSASLDNIYINKASVKAGAEGFYNSLENKIVWDRNTNQSLSEMDPSDEKNFSFNFNLLTIPPTIKNPIINIETTVSGTRSLQGGDTEAVSTKIAKNIKIMTNVGLLAKTLYSGVIQNTGPTPPQAEKATTYSIEWTLSNTHNDVSNTSVFTTLPPYAQWTGVIYPTTENIVYDNETKTVRWNPGAIPAGAGFIYSPRTVAFQVKVIPSVSQIGNLLNITNNISLSALDNFTNTNINLTIPPLNTKTYNSSFGGEVVK